MKLVFRVAASVGLLACAASMATAQFEGELTAKRRLFPGVGNGIRAVRRGRDGRTYVLNSQGVLVFDAKERQLTTINAPAAALANSKSAEPGISFAEDCDIAADGTVYVADRAANLVAVYSSDGARLRSIAVNAPLSVAALPDGEVAVSTLHDPHLITVFEKNGREIRDFGELEDISSRTDMNRFLNSGFLASDALGHVYYAFVYTPEPTVHQFDVNGYATQVIQYAEIDAFAPAQAARKEIERQEKRGKQPAFKPILTAIAVVRETGEVWIALHSRLLRFDQEGNRQATYQLYTPEGTRLEASTILVDNNRIIVGNDPLGVFEFERPDIKLEQKSGK
ncbi:MAG: hypothetical protein M3N22_01165 [Acidobacteriota bacterium]|nr:hypothetical protein [Acidobacteriota bacterium]